jgi:hypothetical protein
LGQAAVARELEQSVVQLAAALSLAQSDVDDALLASQFLEVRWGSRTQRRALLQVFGSGGTV